MLNVIFIKKAETFVGRDLLKCWDNKSAASCWLKTLREVGRSVNALEHYDQIQTSHGFYGAILKQARAAEHNILDKIVSYHKRLVVIFSENH